MLNTKVKLSDQYYLLDGLVYSNAKPDTLSPLAIMSSLAGGEEKALESLAARFKLVPPGTPGVVVSAVTVNRMPCYSVQFEGVEGTVTVPGKFLAGV